MKRIVLLNLALLLSVGVTGQEWGLPSGHNIRSIQAGYTTFRAPSLAYALFGNDGTAPVFSSFMTFGYYSNATILVGRSGAFDGAFAYNFYYPQEFVLIPDTLKYRVGGWELMTSIYGFDLLASVKSVDLVLAPGIFWGSIRLRKYNSTGNFKANELFKNPFITPMFRADLRVVIRRFVLGGRFTYRYDITNSRWKKGSSVVLPGYKCVEMQHMVYIGITIKYDKK